MHFILAFVIFVVGVSGQIYTQIQQDGYHYDLPSINERLSLPGEIKKAPLPVKSVTTPAPITLPPLPLFVPKINLPKVIPSSQPLPVKPKVPKILPEVKKPAPFAAPAVIAKASNEYLPPKTSNEYLPPVEDLTDWDDWKKKFNKRYADQQEDDIRHAIFDDNVNFITSHNAIFGAGLESFDCLVNKFADLKTEEFVQQRTGLRLKGRSANQLPSHFYDAPHAGNVNTLPNSDITELDIRLLDDDDDRDRIGGDFPPKSLDGTDLEKNIFMPSPMLEKDVKDEVDWRKEGAITPVKDQGNCASCWAFSANGALEAHNFLRKKTGPIALSEQNLIDCVKENDGCDGGYMTNAYIYAAKNPGVDKESSYPYEAKQSQCRFKAANVGGECMTHMEIQIGNEKALEQAIATVGPVSAGIDGGQRSFQFYKSGYYYDSKCEQDVNHAVLIVGYGTTESGEEYWICKNSWDTDWGEDGYIRMAKNNKNHCGITNLASYPIV